MPVSSRHKTGERNPESGVFECESCKAKGGKEEIPLTEGKTFPPCAKEGGIAVTWHMIKSLEE